LTGQTRSGCKTATAGPQDTERVGFIKQAFLQYYRKQGSRISLPPDFQAREFAFLAFGERFMTRHKAVSSHEELVNMILTLAPSDVYYSTAYYAKPAQEMERKGWLGSDLVFDVDADHIETSCKANHDMWSCGNCGLTKRGKVPAQCPGCGKTKLEERTWFCDQCLKAAKNEVLKLVGFLKNDFGISEEDMHIFFSGHRGYHLHVRTDEVRRLDESQRKEIVDYVMGLGLDAFYQGLYKKPKDVIVGPQPDDPGWRGRFAREIHRVILKGTEDELVDLGFSRRQAGLIVKERTQREERWGEEILWSEFEDRFRVKDTAWKAMISRSISKGALLAEIDTVVTTDTHRLIRLPETLNGKTGLRAMAVPDLDAFDPFSDPVAFEGEETVHIVQAPAFRIGKTTYGPYTREDVTLPVAAAMLLLCKGLGGPVQK
jgi:DNA primase small subunit